MVLLKLCVQTGDDGSSHTSQVLVSLPQSLEHVHKFLFLVRDACSKTSTLALLDKTSDLHLQVPVSSQHAVGRASSLQLLGYGLKPDLPLQRYLAVCSGSTQLSASATPGMLVLSKHAEESPSMLEWETEEEFPAHLDRAQTEMWGLPSPPDKEGVPCLLLCRQSRPAFQESLTFRTATQGHIYNLHASLPSRQKVKVKVVSMTKEDATYRLLHSFTSIDLTTYLSKQDLKTLKQMALRHRQSLGTTKEISLTYFFRNRWTQYFLDILSKHAGVMAPYPKDHNGDPHSAINGNLEGLFFSASPDFATLKPPQESLFGEWRLHVPVEVMFHEATNLYFADFYCHVSAHYVTLVLTNAGSEADQFCERRLLKLDPFHNDFLYKVEASVQGGRPTVHTYLAKSFHVELLYTESLNIGALMASHGRDKVFFRPCKLQGRGRSQPRVIEKKTCSICNLKV